MIENNESSEGVANNARYLIALNSNVGLVIQERYQHQGTSVRHLECYEYGNYSIGAIL